MSPADAIAHSILFRDILILLVAAVTAVVVLSRVGGSPIVGFLVAGAAIGPLGFGVITDSDRIHTFANVGVIFLMFMIGLELSFERLRAMRVDVFGLGFLQMAVTMAVVTAIAVLFHRTVSHAVIIGGALALSSTAVVLQTLKDRGAMAGLIGRKAFAILLFQDLAVIPLLFLITILQEDTPSLGLAAVLSVGQALLAIAVVIVLGRLILRPLFRAVAATHSSEVFTAASLLTLFGIASAMEAVGLSMELGAFLAGLLIAETEYRQVIERDIEPYKGLMLALFFITVGMDLDARFVVHNLPWVFAVLLAIIAIKTAVVAVIAPLFRLSLGAAIRLGLTLAQIGEFAFVIFGLAAKSFLSPDVAHVLFVAAGLSIALTPVLAMLGERIEKRLQKDHIVPPVEKLAAVSKRLEGHVILAGYGRVGWTVAQLLEQQKIPYVALDLNPTNVAAAFDRGLPVFYGDASRHDILETAGIDRAAIVVVTINQSSGAADTVAAVKHLAPNMVILARAHDLRHAQTLEKLGATKAVPEIMEGSLQLGGRVLEAVGVPEAAVNAVIAEMREDDYAAIAKRRDAVQ